MRGTDPVILRRSRRIWPVQRFGRRSPDPSLRSGWQGGTHGCVVGASRCGEL